MSAFDQESIVYGVIRHLPVSNTVLARNQRQANWQALQSLPTAKDDEGSFFCREMFAMPGSDIFSGTYHSQIIHFAASYQAVEYEWEHWLTQFESLLKKMYWISATVHLETELSGKHVFNWHSDKGHTPSDSHLKMRCEWEREGSFI